MPRFTRCFPFSVEERNKKEKKKSLKGAEETMKEKKYDRDFIEVSWAEFKIGTLKDVEESVLGAWVKVGVELETVDVVYQSFITGQFVEIIKLNNVFINLLEI